MSLIKCPECNKEVSDRAETCIHCGYPIKNEMKKYIQVEEDAAVCPKCGDVDSTSNSSLLENYLNKPCYYCGSRKVKKHIINPPSTAYVEEYYEYYNKLVGGTIDKKLYLKWQKELRQQIAESEARIAAEPQCPYCKSTNLKKITSTSRWLSAGFWGLGSSKIGKQWHCNKCGSDF